MSLPDLIAPGLRLLFVGFNPSIRAAETGHPYSGRNNRFWELLAAAGLTPRRMAPHESRSLLELSIGVTDLVKRPTRSASEVSYAEYRAGAARLQQLVTEYAPRVVCYNGKGVYLRAAGMLQTPWGRQASSLVEGTTDFVAPSPSGLARLPFAHKLYWYRELRVLVESAPA